MSVSNEQIEDNELIEKEPQQNEAFEAVRNINDMRQLRQEIKIIADESWKKQIISDKSYSEYSKLAMDIEDQKMTLEMLKSVRNFAKSHEEKAEAIQKRIELAKRSGVASENDEKFLMSHLILDNESDFVSRSSEAETLIMQKIARMEEDRKAYDKIADHKLVKNVGYLKPDANTKLEIPDAKGFLAMTVPERRAFLKKIEEALPMAEKYAEKVGTEETKELNKKYLEALDKALQKKIIGKKTHEKFVDGFNKIDKKEKEAWLKEFPNQMAKYEKLWGEIRGTLKGDALAKMELLRDDKGYTEIFVEFGNVKESEKNRLDTDYSAKLIDFQKSGMVGKHTVDEFSNWMRQQDIKEKYKAVELMHDGSGGQMEKYSKLNEDIKKNLPKDARDYMKSKIDEWGYAEMKSQYDRFISGEKVPKEQKPDPLSRIGSSRTRAAIVEADEMLEKQGGGKRGLFLSRIRHMFREETGNSFDAGDFQSKLKREKKELKPTKEDIPVTKPDKDGISDFQNTLRRQRSGESEDKRESSASETENEMKKMEKTGQARLVSEDGFKQVETNESSGMTKRKARIEINREKGINRFLVEDMKHGYHAKTEGGKDEISIAFHTSDASTVELKLSEIKAMEKYLEEKEEEARKMDKAA
jgi:hypothetical protein